MKICDAVIDLLERSQLSNLEVLRRAELGISKTTLTRYLLGQSGARPSPELVATLVALVADELRVDPHSLYAEFPVLRDYVQPNPVTHTHHPDTSEAAQGHHVSNDFVEKTGWLWEQVIAGNEHVAALALHGFSPDPFNAGLALRMIAERDIGGAAALLRALSEIYGPAHAEKVQEHLDPETVASFDVSNYRRIGPPLWNLAHRTMLDERNPRLIGRRLGMLIGRGDLAQAREELAGLTTVADRGSKALEVVYGIVESSGPNTAHPGYERALTVLNAMVNPPTDGESVEEALEPSPDHSTPLSTIIAALLVEARASGTAGDHDMLIAGLEPAAFATLLRWFSQRSLLTSSPAGRANLTDFLAAATVEQLTEALPRIDTAHSIDHIADVLLADNPGRLLTITAHVPGPAAEFALQAFTQCETHWPQGPPKGDLVGKLINYVRNETDEFLMCLARTWPQETIVDLVAGIKSDPGHRTGRGVQSLAALIVHADPPFRVTLTHRVFSGFGHIEPGSRPEADAVKMWVGVIVRSPHIAKALEPTVSAFHDAMLKFRYPGTLKRDEPVRKSELAWNIAMGALEEGDFATAAVELRKLPPRFDATKLAWLGGAELPKSASAVPEADRDPSLTEPNWRHALRRVFPPRAGS
ncbi:hypothetical protein [Nocardia amikacinitolerans]|uniref:hypothetical protein n=1 Tax=Nocardia amikacinitolerans TaxID=756689 RepID=UPI0020A26DA0|nr:hypothetical protein [Nocardia amikacinitolerans]